MNEKLKTIGASICAAVICASLTGCAKEDEKPELNESNIESHIESIFGGSLNNPSSSTPAGTSEPEEVKFVMTDEIKNADLDSGLIQLNNEVFRQGGYIAVADFVEKYKDIYDITYSVLGAKKGTYEECKEFLVEYKDYNSYFQSYIGGDELEEFYILKLTPKTEEI